MPKDFGRVSNLMCAIFKQSSCSLIGDDFPQYLQQFRCSIPVTDGHGFVEGCSHDFTESAFGTLSAETL